MCKISIRSHLSLALSMFTLALGCETGVPQPDSIDHPEAEVANADLATTSESKADAIHQGKNQATLNNVLSSWEAGDQDRAVELLVSIPWNEPTRISDSPLLSMTEQEFMSLPRAESDRYSEESIKLTRTIKSLMRHAFSLGEKAQSSGDQEGAKAYYEGVLHLGQALSNPDKLKILQLLGSALVKMANERIATLD